MANGQDTDEWKSEEIAKLQESMVALKKKYPDGKPTGELREALKKARKSNPKLSKRGKKTG